MKSVPRRSGLGWWMSSKVWVKKRSWKSARKNSTTATITNNINKQPTNIPLRAFLGHSRMRHWFTATNHSFKGPPAFNKKSSRRECRNKTHSSSIAAPTPQLDHFSWQTLGQIQIIKSHQRRCHTQGIAFYSWQKSAQGRKSVGKIVAYRGKTTWLSQWLTFELLGFWGSLAFYTIK